MTDLLNRRIWGWLFEWQRGRHIRTGFLKAAAAASYMAAARGSKQGQNEPPDGASTGADPSPAPGPSMAPVAPHSPTQPVSETQGAGIIGGGETPIHGVSGVVYEFPSRKQGLTASPSAEWTIFASKNMARNSSHKPSDGCSCNEGHPCTWEPKQRHTQNGGVFGPTEAPNEAADEGQDLGSCGGAMEAFRRAAETMLDVKREEAGILGLLCTAECLVSLSMAERPFAEWLNGRTIVADLGWWATQHRRRIVRRLGHRLRAEGEIG